MDISNIQTFTFNKSLYENGFDLGRNFKNKININKFYEIRNRLYKLIQNKHPKEFTFIKQRINEWIFCLNNKFKLSVEDITGFSDALEIKDNIILEINILVDVFDYMCTLIGVISEKNIWHLRILDIDIEFRKIIKELELPLLIVNHKSSSELNFISFNYLGFFNFHSSFINNMTVSTFSWNNLNLQEFLKNEIPPLFHLKYISLKFKNMDNIYKNLLESNILYDGYVMLMMKNRAILYDFDQNRNDTEEIYCGYTKISDFKFKLEYEFDKIFEVINNIPNDNRCFTLLYDFTSNAFFICNGISNDFKKINFNK